MGGVEGQHEWAAFSALVLSLFIFWNTSNEVNVAILATAALSLLFAITSSTMFMSQGQLFSSAPILLLVILVALVAIFLVSGSIWATIFPVLTFLMAILVEGPVKWCVGFAGKGGGGSSRIPLFATLLLSVIFATFLLLHVQELQEPVSTIRFKVGSSVHWTYNG